MKERREIDEVFFKQGPILKHNLPVEILGDPPPPKGDPKMKEVVRKEILKLLEAGIIYPVVDSKWVSDVHCLRREVLL